MPHMRTPAGPPGRDEPPAAGGAAGRAGAASRRLPARPAEDGAHRQVSKNHRFKTDL